jgi:hypothetical protein
VSKREKVRRSEADKEKIQQAITTLKGETVPKKGGERICSWDEKTARLIFKNGGAKRLKDYMAARRYVEKNGYRLE